MHAEALRHHGADEGLGGPVLMALALHLGVALLLLVAVVVHAVVGYLDTRTAFGRRTLFPSEQHIHSVLDMAPWIALACYVVFASPGVDAWSWRITLRAAGADPALWVALIVPALLLCGVPAAWEFRAAWRARKA